MAAMQQMEGVERYVEAALRLLQFVEGRRPTGRRFGSEADARWSSFRGDLETIDRIELMIRDADTEWPGGFGPRVIFGLEGVPEDEPFGSRWTSVDPVDAEQLWRRVKDEAEPKNVGDALRAIARAWSLTLKPIGVGKPEANERLVVVGPSAIAATLEAFASNAALDWAEQVIVVASVPAHRQLAAAGTALLNALHATTIVNVAEVNARTVRKARLIASEDTDPDDRVAAEKLAG